MFRCYRDKQHIRPFFRIGMAINIRLLIMASPWLSWPPEGCAHNILSVGIRIKLHL